MTPFRTAALVPLVAGLLLALGPVARGTEPAPVAAPEGWSASVPPEYRARVEAQVLLAGANGPELVAFLTGVPESRRPGAAFLVAYMPLADLVSSRAAVLREHCEYAYRARETFPWARSVPEAVFLHYVLPCRVAEERVAPWRRYLMEQLAPVVEGASGLKEASFRVNQWLGRPRAEGVASRVRFVQTEARDQGPFETLRSGYGRCEEMMIAFIAAARAVGIPARSVWTPWWATGDSNHAWVEIWSNEDSGEKAQGEWFPMGACEPGDSPKFPNCWFSGKANRACVVEAAVYGVPREPLPEPVEGAREGYVILNCIGAYSRACDLELEVVGGDGKPAPGVPAALSVFNFGAFRSFSTRTTGPDGVARFRTGIGDYLATAGGKDGARAWSVVSTRPGVLRARLTLAEGAAPDGFIRLGYPTPDEAGRR